MELPYKDAVLEKVFSTNLESLDMLTTNTFYHHHKLEGESYFQRHIRALDNKLSYQY